MLSDAISYRIVKSIICDLGFYRLCYQIRFYNSRRPAAVLAAVVAARHGDEGVVYFSR